LKELKLAKQNGDNNQKMIEKHLTDKEGIILQLNSAQADLMKKLQNSQEILADTENVVAKSRSEIKALTESLKEKTETVASRDVTIKALKLAQTDLEKKLAETKETLALSEAHSNHFACDSQTKDSLIHKLEVKLKDQDKQWEDDVAALTSQLATEKSNREAIDAKLKQSQDENKGLCGDLEQLRAQRTQLSEEKEALNKRLQDSKATCDTLEKKLQERRDDFNVVEAE
jgi:chromosome segregation ATPase